MRQQLQRAFIGAIALATAATMAGCSSNSGAGGSGSGNSNDQVSLTIATFGEFGYEDLLTEYHNLHPNITVTQTKTAQNGPYTDDLNTKLAAGSGLADVVALEEGTIPNLLPKAQLFNNLASAAPKDRWLPWKYQGGVANDGTVIGLGTDIGPEAMCYRKDLFDAAGLPSDPAAVKTMFASWDSYFKAGDQYVQKTGKPWFDSDSQIFNAMVNQLDQGYFDKSDNLIIDKNDKLKAAWDQVTAAGQKGQTAKLVAFSNEWVSGFKAGAFATKSCPAWMLGVIKDDAGPENAGKWAIADAFPGGFANWGGSYLAVPKQTKHVKEATDLAVWLTDPAQQIKAFKAKGPFPSQVEALKSQDLLSVTNDYFVGSPKTGELFANRANGVVAQHKGPGDSQIQENATSTALQAVEQGKSPQDGWQQAVDAAKKIANK